MSHVSFLSDFGLTDEFVGVVHGVIAKLAPKTKVIDVTHGIPRGDVRSGALALTRSIQYLPHGVILAVVDPGVGTSRRAIAAETADGMRFVGPDNGLLGPAVATMGGATKIVELTNPEAQIPSAGATFAGRDVFAPAAALLSSGEAQLDDLGDEVSPDSVTPLLIPLPEIEPARVVGEAWWVDAFGNVQSNVGPEDLAMAGISSDVTVTVRVGATEYEVPWVETYGQVDEGDPLLHVDSSGLMALAVRGGSATEYFNLATGTALTLAG
jgi:S-adenosylmethionine hydrolase